MNAVHASIYMGPDTTVEARSCDRPSGPLVWLEVGPGAATIFLVPEAIVAFRQALDAAEAAVAPPGSVLVGGE